jgi:hypothetical protein
MVAVSHRTQTEVVITVQPTQTTFSIHTQEIQSHASHSFHWAQSL